MKQRKSFQGSSGDDYIFSRFKEFEIDRFVNEINNIINDENVISSNKIIERIKYQRNSEKIKYYLVPIIFSILTIIYFHFKRIKGHNSFFGYLR